MTNLAWTLLVFALHPWAPIETTHAETVEHNAFFDCDGKLLFEQLIAWDEEPHVLDWRLVRGGPPDPQRGRLTLWDKDRYRRVRFETWHRTWTQHDPEQEDRHWRTVDERPGL